MIEVAGVDGSRRGWVIARLAVVQPSPGRCGGRDATVGSAARRTVSFSVVDDLARLFADVAAGRIAAAAIDMPIGLADAERRACDSEARRRLGARRASVFPAPIRAALGATDHAEALARSRAASGRGLSVQAFHLLPKIGALDALMAPDLEDRIGEAHPELAFARLAGAPAAHPKRTPAGRAERRALLDAAGIAPPPGLRLPGTAVDDLLDATVLTLTAERLRTGEAQHLGDGARDARGLEMRIVV